MYGARFDPGGPGCGAAASFGSPGHGCHGAAAARCGGAGDDAPSTPTSRLSVEASPENVAAQVRELLSRDRPRALLLARVLLDQCNSSELGTMSGSVLGDPDVDDASGHHVRVERLPRITRSTC
jgi:hypothetical protein